MGGGETEGRLGGGEEALGMVRGGDGEISVHCGGDGEECEAERTQSSPGDDKLQLSGVYAYLPAG